MGSEMARPLGGLPRFEGLTKPGAGAPELARRFFGSGADPGIQCRLPSQASKWSATRFILVADHSILGGLINYILEHALWFKEYVLNYTNTA
jgi:hypothetical protein